MRSYGGSSSGLVPDHWVGLLAHLVEVGDAQLPSLEEVFDMRARLLQGEEPRVALARPEQPQRHPEERHGLAAEFEDLAEAPNLVERLEIKLEAAKGRYGCGRLVRRDAREHVIGGEE